MPDAGRGAIAGRGIAVAPLRCSRSRSSDPATFPPASTPPSKPRPRRSMTRRRALQTVAPRMALLDLPAA